MKIQIGCSLWRKTDNDNIKRVTGASLRLYIQRDWWNSESNRLSLKAGINIYIWNSLMFSNPSDSVLFPCPGLPLLLLKYSLENKFSNSKTIFLFDFTTTEKKKNNPRVYETYNHFHVHKNFLYHHAHTLHIKIHFYFAMKNWTRLGIFLFVPLKKKKKSYSFT